MNLRKSHIGLIFIFTILTLWTLFPLFFTVVTAFKTATEILSYPPTLIPKKPTVEPFNFVLSNEVVMAYFRNSILISTLSTLIALILAIPAAYCGARYRFKGKDTLMFLILTFRFLPPASVVISIFIFARNLGIIDTIGLLANVYAAMNLPIAVWVLMSYIREIPKEMEDSFMIDGYSRIQAVFKVTLPLLKTGIVAVALLLIALSFGEFLFAVILTFSPAAKTLPVGLSEAMGGEWGYHFDRIAAMLVLGLIPLLILFIALRKHLVRGLTFGIIR